MNRPIVDARRLFLAPRPALAALALSVLIHAMAALPGGLIWFLTDNRNAGRARAKGDAVKCGGV